MVLDDASPQAGSYTAHNSPSGPQMDQPSALTKYFPVTIKPELVVQPDPFTLYFGFLGSWNWKRKVAETLSWRVESSWVLTARAPTQEEMDAFTTISTRSLYYRRVGLPLSAFLGTAYLYNQARKSPHFPQAATPAQLYNALRNVAATDPALFRSSAGSYLFKMIFIVTTGTILSNAAGAWSDTKSLLSDSRLQQFLADMKHQKPDDIRKRQQQAVVDRVRSARSGEGNVRSQMKREIDQVGDHSEGSSQERGYGDSASASSSPITDTSYNTSSYGGYDNTNTSADQPSSVSESLRNRTFRGRTSEPSQSNSSSDFFFGGSDDDDASPTAPEYRHTNMDGSPAGSAWDRIRSLNASNSRSAQASQSRMTPGPYQANSEGTSDSDPSGNVDRYDDGRRDREQARADFDRMMDAERNASTDRPPRRAW